MDVTPFQLKEGMFGDTCEETSSHFILTDNSKEICNNNLDRNLE